MSINGSRLVWAAAGVVAISVGMLSAGLQAQAAPSAGNGDVVTVAAERSSEAQTGLYRANYTGKVYASPSLDSSVSAEVLEGEFFHAYTEPRQGSDGSKFLYAWTYNYRTGHFFRGYIEVGNAVLVG